MILLLPPSETKRDGGSNAVLDLSALGFPELTRQRRTVIAALRRLARNLSAMAMALKLGKGQQAELIRNRQLGSSPTMPAIERYTGVLYDALGAETLDAAARAFAADRVIIHSALFGLLRADDPIPAYRLSHDSRLPGLSLKATWRGQVTAALEKTRGLVIDLRSEAYVELGPVPGGRDSVYLRLVSQGADGRVRALNHFNKKGKGEFTRALLDSGEDLDSVGELLAWASSRGIVLIPGAAGELDLVV